MIYTIILVLIGLWLFSMFMGFLLEGLIHLLLFIALGILVVRFIRRRKAANQ